jgi:hypothetical protein
MKPTKIAVGLGALMLAGFVTAAQAQPLSFQPLQPPVPYQYRPPPAQWQPAPNRYQNYQPQGPSPAQIQQLFLMRPRVCGANCY